MNSVNESKQLPSLAKRLSVTWLVISAIGFVDAAYLTATYYRGALPTCGLVEGCETVLSSHFAAIGGVPIALAGSLFYLAVFLLIFAYVDTHRWIFVRLAVLLVSAGFLVTLFLLYLQAFVLKAYCQFCLLSAVTSTVLFVVGLLMLQQRQRTHKAGFVAQGSAAEDWQIKRKETE